MKVEMHTGCFRTSGFFIASASWQSEEGVPGAFLERGYVTVHRPTEPEARAAVLALLARMGVPVPSDATVDRHEERDLVSEDPELEPGQRLRKSAPLGPKIRVLPLDYPIPLPPKEALPPYKTWESSTGRRDRHTSGPPRGGYNAFRFGQRKRQPEGVPVPDLSDSLAEMGIDEGVEGDCE